MLEIIDDLRIILHKIWTTNHEEMEQPHLSGEDASY